jgi:hypothetical protein
MPKNFRTPEHSLSRFTGNDYCAFNPAKAGQVMAKLKYLRRRLNNK